jgi:microbial collagenase
MYDFGEGKWPIEGDAIQDYRYNFSGEYVITFIVVRDDGTKQQSSRKIILKDAPKRIVINTSIDFDTNGTIGQIETYSWDFWDGNTSGDSNPSHSYQAKGKYTLKVTVTYADKTVKSTDREIIVNE